MKLTDSINSKLVLDDEKATYQLVPTEGHRGILVFKIQDGELSSNIATITVIVDPVNDSPVLSEILDQNINEDET